MSKEKASSDAFTSSSKNPTTHPIYQLYLFCNVSKMSGVAIFFRLGTQISFRDFDNGVCSFFQAITRWIRR
jgi:hypothetical protein